MATFPQAPLPGAAGGVLCRRAPPHQSVLGLTLKPNASTLLHRQPNTPHETGCPHTRQLSRVLHSGPVRAQAGPLEGDPKVPFRRDPKVPSEGIRPELNSASPVPPNREPVPLQYVRSGSKLPPTPAKSSGTPKAGYSGGKQPGSIPATSSGTSRAGYSGGAPPGAREPSVPMILDASLLPGLPKDAGRKSSPGPKGIPKAAAEYSSTGPKAAAETSSTGLSPSQQAGSAAAPASSLAPQPSPGGAGTAPSGQPSSSSPARIPAPAWSATSKRPVPGRRPQAPPSGLPLGAPTAALAEEEWLVLPVQGGAYNGWLVPAAPSQEDSTLIKGAALAGGVFLAALLLPKVVPLAQSIKLPRLPEAASVGWPWQQWGGGSDHDGGEDAEGAWASEEGTASLAVDSEDEGAGTPPEPAEEVSVAQRHPESPWRGSPSRWGREKGGRGERGRVLVAPFVDDRHAHLLEALKALKVVEAQAAPDALCRRGDFARWLVEYSQKLTRSSSLMVSPAMFVDGYTQLAFDDVVPEHPDFRAIQGLAEAGIIRSRLTDSDTEQASSAHAGEEGDGASRAEAGTGEASAPERLRQSQSTSEDGAAAAEGEESPGASSWHGSGLADARRSLSSIRGDREAGQGASPHYFQPDSPLKRQELLAWKFALEHQAATAEPTTIDPSRMRQLFGLLDAHRLDEDARLAVASELQEARGSGKDNLVSFLFGYTRRLDPTKPVTNAQAAACLAHGQSLAQIEEDQRRREAETAQRAVGEAERAREEAQEEVERLQGQLKEREEETQRVAAAAAELEGMLLLANSALRKNQEEQEGLTSATGSTLPGVGVEQSSGETQGGGDGSSAHAAGEHLAAREEGVPQEALEPLDVLGEDAGVLREAWDQDDGSLAVAEEALLPRDWVLQLIALRAEEISLKSKMSQGRQALVQHLSTVRADLSEAAQRARREVQLSLAQGSQAVKWGLVEVKANIPEPVLQGAGAALTVVSASASWCWHTVLKAGQQVWGLATRL